MLFTKKLKIVFILFFIIVLISTSCFADDYIEPLEDISEFLTIATSSSASPAPDTNSRACIILERSTKAILFGKNEFDIRKMASTTKIMTAIVVLENEKDLSNIVTVSKKAAGIGGSRLGLSSNCKITVKDLLDVGKIEEDVIEVDINGNEIKHITNSINEISFLDDCKIQIYEKYGKIFCNLEIFFSELRNQANSRPNYKFRQT